MLISTIHFNLYDYVNFVYSDRYIPRTPNGAIAKLVADIALFIQNISYNQSQNLNIMTAIDIKDLAINYITNEAGEKTAVILPIEQFESLLEDIEDLAVVAERKNEPTTSHADLLEELKEDGII